VLVDIATGRELFGEHEHALLPPASLTKLLTALIAVNWLAPGTFIPVSARTAAVAPDKVGMKAGQRWSFVIALHALLISSSNDAAYALAERVAGSLERFGVLMRTAASQLGLSDTPVLRDPAGLDGTEGVGGGNLMSAWDVAIAARDLMANPTLAGIVALKGYRFNGPDRIVYQLSSHNLGFLNSYPGAIGVKTGYTERAGVCVAEEARRGGRYMLAVVMGGVAPDQTAGMLLDKGFATSVGAETHDAVLPPVRQPARTVAAVPRRTEPVTAAPRPVQPVATPTTLAPSRRSSRHVIPGPTGLGLVVVVTLALVAVAGFARRRRH
jgi:D-alanyl-D-alanine carboxypeptidase (penicillin-binding protein 5/6)